MHVDIGKGLCVAFGGVSVAFGVWACGRGCPPLFFADVGEGVVTPLFRAKNFFGEDGGLTRAGKYV